MEERDTALLKVKNDLQSAYNQMAKEFATAMRQKEALLAVNVYEL